MSFRRKIKWFESNAIPTYDKKSEYKKLGKPKICEITHVYKNSLGEDVGCKIIDETVDIINVNGTILFDVKLSSLRKVK